MPQIECWQCKHWYKPMTPDEVYGTCGLITDDRNSGNAAMVTACSCVEPDLRTRQEFSCNLAELSIIPTIKG